MRILTILLVALSLFFVACDKKKKPVSDAEIGLRKSSVENESAVNLALDFNYTTVQPGESASLIQERSFENAPPLIPHAIEDMLPITKDSNMCLSCHIKELAADMNTLPAPASHYFDMQANKPTGDVVSNERFNCDQCHVPQTDAVPLVANNFQAVFQGEDSKKKSDLFETLNEGVVEEKIKTREAQ